MDILEMIVYCFITGMILVTVFGTIHEVYKNRKRKREIKNRRRAKRFRIL